MLLASLLAGCLHPAPREARLAALCHRSPSEALDRLLGSRIHVTLDPLSPDEQARLLHDAPAAPLDLRAMRIAVDAPIRARLVRAGVAGPLDDFADEDARLEPYLDALTTLSAALPPLPEPALRPDPRPPAVDPIGTAAVQVGILPMCLLGRLLSGGGGDCSVSPVSSGGPPRDPVAEREAARTGLVDALFEPCAASADRGCFRPFLTVDPDPQVLLFDVILADEDGSCVRRVEVTGEPGDLGS